MEIVKGLTLGERIVTAGAFLLDSESPMKPAAPATAASTGDVSPAHGEAPRGHTGHH